MRWLFAALGLVLLLGANGGGCSQPNVVGVQDYGSVTGRVLDATTNLPIANAIVSVGSLFTASSDAQGGFVMSHVPIGEQTVTVRSPGYSTVSASVAVVKNQGASIGYLRLVPIANPAGVPTLPPPSIPIEHASPTPSPVPASTPTPTPTV